MSERMRAIGILGGRATARKFWCRKCEGIPRAYWPLVQKVHMAAYYAGYQRAVQRQRRRGRDAA